MVTVRLAQVMERIRDAERRGGRRPGRVRLVAVTKGRAVETVLEAYRAGQRHFGESRSQDLTDKALALPSDIEWHFVGPLQRNKVRVVRPQVVLLHSLDRPELAETWVKGPGQAPPALLEVNVGGEEQKLGVDPDRAEELLEQVLGLGVDVRGLMTIPPRVERSEQARGYFEELAELRDRLAARWPKVRELSMGMSEDFEEAVEAGSTIVRIGRAIFGSTDD
ncbi:MAG: YggS family pyridoxal phosphate-dependent enzyme [Actinomycetota bacterium]|nr:YggS family pyridoxal phosphate-dependent enzyme [Actinomycetota bacterium]